jgi:hypothetical protein
MLVFIEERVGRLVANPTLLPWTHDELPWPGKYLVSSGAAFLLPAPVGTLRASIPRPFGERSMRGTFEYKLDGSGDAINLNIDLDALSANALVRLDRYINWADVLKLTENDPEAAYAAERLHTVLQHMGK